MEVVRSLLDGLVRPRLKLKDKFLRFRPNEIPINNKCGIVNTRWEIANQSKLGTNLLGKWCIGNTE